MDNAPFRYRAFISYSHRDERWAKWLHRSLERYPVPRRLVGRPTIAGPVPPRIAPVFRDRDELPSASDLSRVVGAALEASAALIVVCSPAAARSRWVNEEIRTFQRLGRREQIFCLIVAGDPAGAADEQCFPEALRGGTEESPAAEPIGADLRPGKDGQRAALLKLVAGLLRVGLDELVRRDLQRRNRRLLAISGASVFGMAAALVLLALALIARNEAERQRARAEVQTATAQQTTDFLVQLFDVVDPSEARGNTITAREILDRGAARVDKDLGGQPAVRATLLQTIGRVYTGLGLYEPATDLLSRAVALRQELQTRPTAESIATANALGSALSLKGEYSRATAVYSDALAGARQLFPDGDPLTTQAMNGLADVLRDESQYADAEALYREALRLDRRLHPEASPDVARSLAGLASALLYERRYGDSEAAFREALGIRKQTLGDDHPLIAETMNNLGYLLYSSGRATEAESLIRDATDMYRRILGKEHPFLSSLLNNLARLLLERGAVADAEPLLEEALAGDRKLKDPDNEELIFTLNNLGLARIGLGKYDSAVALLEEARRIADLHGHRMRAQVLGNLAEAYARSGRPADALAAIAAAKPLLAADYADEPWHAANVASIEAAVRAENGNRDGAEAELLRSYATIKERWGTNGVYAQLAARRLERFYSLGGRADLAARYRPGDQARDPPRGEPSAR